MLVRDATKDDYGAILGLMEHLNPDDPKLSDDIGLATFNEIIDSDYFTIIVAVKNNDIIGTCYINIIPNLTRCSSPYGIIENVVTCPEHRRLGAGKALIEYALSYAKSLNCYKVMLLTGRDKEVQEFYKSCGMASGTKTAFVRRWDEN